MERPLLLSRKGQKIPSVCDFIKFLNQYDFSLSIDSFFVYLMNVFKLHGLDRMIKFRFSVRAGILL